MSFSVGTWNILASSLATPDAFPAVPAEYLAWSYRFPKIINQIIKAQNDVIVLQEVDQFKQIKHALEFMDPRRFEGSYYLPFHHNKHGIAVFWNTDKLLLLPNSKKVIEFQPSMSTTQEKDDANFDAAEKCDAKTFGDEKKSIHKNSQRACALTFECKDNSRAKKFTLVGVHLKSKILYENVRVAQIHAILQELDHDYYKDHPIIIAGDMNSFPDGQVYAKLCMEKFVEIRAAKDTLDVSRYSNMFTTRKLRNNDKMYTAVSDYIFWRDSSYSFPLRRRLIVVAKPIYPLVEQLTESEQKCGFPSSNTPSDHIMIAVEFAFLSKDYQE